MPDIHVYVRHCFYSAVSANKGRPATFNRETYFHSLVQSLAHAADNNVYDHVYFYVLLDETHRSKSEGMSGANVAAPQHFTETLQENSPFCYTLHTITAGNEATSFDALLRLVEGQVHTKTVKMDDTLVFLEDDYQVHVEWIDPLQEALATNADYVTLYDHPDKYDTNMYPNLLSKVYCSKSCHFRSIPSTTNSYAMLCKTLVRDMSIHKHFSNPALFSVTNDHEKFLTLWQTRGSQQFHNRSVLVSSLPAFWSHQEQGMVCNLTGRARE